MNRVFCHAGIHGLLIVTGYVYEDGRVEDLRAVYEGDTELVLLDDESTQDAVAALRRAAEVFQ